MANFPEYIHFRIKVNGLNVSIEKANDIEFAPARHGEWIPKNKDGSWRVDTCSACGKDTHYVRYAPAYDFCPNCGAKMDARQPYEPATLTVIPAEKMTEQDKAVKAEALKTLDNEKGV